jgi:hypothetical protein
VYTVFAIYWTAFALWIGFKTSAVYEYLRILPFCERLTHTKEYAQFRKSDPDLRYGDFMSVRHTSFIVRMCACPSCIGVWMAFAACWGFACFPQLPAVYGGGLILYLLFSWFIKKLVNA